MDNKIKVSYSSISKFKACPRKYWLSKTYKDKSLSSALCFGKAFENGITTLFEEGKTLEDAKAVFNRDWTTLPKTERESEVEVFDNPFVKYYASDLDLDLVSMYETLANEWCQEFVNHNNFREVVDGLKNQELVEHERVLMNRLSWLSVQARGHLMIEAFYEEVFPNIEEVIALQRQISLTNGDGDEKIGYIDLIAKYKGYDKAIIFDFKTASYPYTIHKLDTSEQLLGYSVALEQELQSNLIGYIVMLKKPESKRACSQCKAKPESFSRKCKQCGCSTFDKVFKCKTQVLIKEAPDHNLNDIVEDDSNIVKAIKAGIDYKNPESCMMFNNKCEFYDMCWNNKKAEELNNIETKEN